MISPRHLIVGASARTSKKAIEKVIGEVFKRNLVDKVSVVDIPAKRSYMHIDTIFTQIKKDLWIVFGPFSKSGLDPKKPKWETSGILTGMRETAAKIKITQFKRNPVGESYEISQSSLSYLDDLFEQVSKEDFRCEDCDIIYSAGGEFPYNEREQWTDSCNFLALREGIILGYDRNTLTAEELRKRGFRIMKASNFIKAMESGKELDEVIKGDTLITLPSSELSRARGGTHCMSMPLLRD